MNNTSFTYTKYDRYSVLYWKATMQRFASQVRQWFLTPIRQTVSYPEELLVESFILGTDIVLPETMQHSIKIIGIAHVIAVSGSHLTLVMGLLSGVSKMVKRTPYTPIVIIVLMSYAALVGWQPAVTRALLMTVIIVAGKTVLHRQVSASRSLVISALLMVFFDPWVILNIGWQLSVFATAGICWIYPILCNIFFRADMPKKTFPQDQDRLIVTISKKLFSKIWKLSLEAVFATLAASALIWPIMIANFGLWSWGTVVSSLCLWWLFPLVISACFIGVLLVRFLVLMSVHQSLVQICSSLLLELPVRATTWLFEAFGSLEWMLVSVEKLPTSVYLAWYCLVFCLLLLYKQYNLRIWRKNRSLLQPLEYI